jgi:hypothetical protein
MMNQDIDATIQMPQGMGRGRRNRCR